MEAKNRNYILWILLHMVIGATVYAAPFVSKIYGFAIILYGFYYIIRSRNNDHQALYVCAYMVGSEVLLRMTGGNPIYEFSKYGIIFFMILGMYYRGFSKYAIPYWIFLVLLIPGIVVSTQVLDFDAELRKSISFNISGPLCLGISSLYMYGRRVTMHQMNNILLVVAMPIVSTIVYLIFYTPNVRDVITGTSSSYETSGGFGPNQVSTMLGLGMFIFFIRIMMFSKSKIVLLLNLVIFLNVSFRGLMTFSRGGVMTAILMMVILTVILYLKLNSQGRNKLKGITVLFGIIVAAIWLYSANETGGLIQKRYANQDAAGRVKESRLSGRENIIDTEIKFFLDNPIFGVGVARGAELRAEVTGTAILSHNEITRMLSEHGGMGIMALIILFFTPLFLYLDNRSHIYLLCFVCFWLLTINHAAMRLAAPAFIYALSVLKIYNEDEKPVVHRE